MAYYKTIDGDDDLADFEIWTTNDAYARFFDRTPGDLAGTRVSELLPDPDNAATSWRRAYTRVASSGQNEKFELYLSNLDKWFEVQVWRIQKRVIATLLIDITNKKEAEFQSQERTKELSAMYYLSKISHHDTSLAEMLQQIADTLPESWQFPEIAWCRIVLEGHEYKSGSTTDSQWTQSSSIEIEGKRRGKVEIGYSEERPIRDEGPFLKEERQLLEAAADRIGRIVQRKQAEKKLEETKNIIDRSTLVAFTWKNEENWPVEYVSENVRKVFGYSEKEFTSGSVTYEDCIHPKDLERVFSEVQANSQSDVSEFEHRPYRIVTKQGVVKWVTDWTFIERDNRGQVLHYRGIIQDITDRKQAEQELRESEQVYRSLVSNLPGIVYNCENDEHWTMLYMSDRVEDITGYPAEEFIGNRVRSYESIIHEEDTGRVDREVRAAVTAGKKWEIEYRIVDRDGDIHWVWEKGQPIEDRENERVYLNGFIEDITERKQIEKNLRTSLVEKETLLSEIHHRVKNNLAVISGLMQLQVLDTNNKELEHQLYNSIARIKTIASVHELLYRSDSFSRLNFSDTIKELLSHISDTFQADHSVTREIHCDPVTLNVNQAIPASLILNEVLTNVYKHAFTGDHQANLKLTIVEDNGTINVEIEDNGIGIRDAQKEGQNSMGMKLIDTLTTQLIGKSEYQNTGNGTKFILSFKREDRKTGVGNALLD
ncbi:PAS domain-containing protein [Halalkalibaculum sp. DA3122]|uniref:PAS domain-containing protein n=1 Tax=Halalkalibaculum sp. DA3122 TaxID=3373607 RepID=UPI0037542FA8